MRENRHLAAQVRPDHQQRVERVDLGDAHAQTRKHGIRLLVAEIALPQAVIDIVGLKSARDAPRQVQLFERARAAHQDTEVGGSSGVARRSGLYTPS